MATHNKSSGSLPYSESLARCFRAFDLPFGTSLDRVTRQYEAYVSKCHPDRHVHDPDKLADAYRLTGILTWAHGEIMAAWQAHRESPKGPLDFDPDLAKCYQALDLPYGASMDEVTYRWKSYLKKCHPDRHAQDAAILPDATRLTQLLTQAFEKIRQAWKEHEAL